MAAPRMITVPADGVEGLVAYIHELRKKVRDLRRTLEAAQGDPDDVLAGLDVMHGDPAQLRATVEQRMGVTPADDSDLTPPRPQPRVQQPAPSPDGIDWDKLSKN